MSYEIIRSIRVIKDEDGYYYVKGCSAESNVRPLYFSEWTYGKGRKLSKEFLEKHILYMFFIGSYQKGTSKYKKVVDKVLCDKECDIMRKYYEYNKLLKEVSEAKSKIEDKDSDSYKTLVERLDSLREARDKEVVDSLYSYMINNMLTVNKPVQFTIRDKNSNDYVNKVKKYSYTVSLDKHIFTSASLWQRVNEHKWWNENFIIERVS